MNDPISDLLTRIRNAYLARHKEVLVPASGLKRAVAQVLLKNGFVEKVEVEGKGASGNLKIGLRYIRGMPGITKVIRQSKPGRRVYRRARRWPIVLAGEGLAIVSTSAGIMPAKEARKKGLGGELLATVW